MDVDKILENMGGGKTLSFDILSILKIPLIIVLIGNILFSALLFLRVRILADTFKTPGNKFVKIMFSTYLIILLFTTLLSLLFVILT